MATVTLQPITVDFYAGQGDVARVRVYYDAGFVSSGGVPIAASSPYGGSFYREVRCPIYLRTVAGSLQSRSFDIPSLEVESTEDALDNPFATMSVYVCDARGLLVGAYSDFTNVVVPPTIAGSASYTWAQLAEYQAGPFNPGTPAAIETIQDTVAQMLRGSGGGTFPYDDVAGTLTIPTITSPVTGGGQAGRLAQWNGNSSLGNADVYVDEDGNYGFGVAAPLNQKLTLPNNTYYGGLNPAGTTARLIAGIDGIDRTIFGSHDVPTVLRGDPLVVEADLRPDVPGTRQLGTPSAPFSGANLDGSLRLMTEPDGRLIGLGAPSDLAASYDLKPPALPPSTDVVQVFSPSGQATWRPYESVGKLVIQEDGANLAARPKLNFGAGLLAQDNPLSKRIDVTLNANYQSVLNGAGATLTPRPKLKLSNRFAVLDEPGTESTVIDLAVNYQTVINEGGQALTQRGAFKFGPGFTLTDNAGGYTLVDIGNLPNLPQFSLANYGGQGDGKRIADAVMAAGVAALNSSAANFTPADVNKIVRVQGAGAGGGVLATVISAYVSPTQVTLAAAAATAVSGTNAIYGTDNLPAFNAVKAALPATGGEILVGAGAYLLSDTVVFGNGSAAEHSSANGIAVYGQGVGASEAEGPYHKGGTELWWAGAAGGTMMRFDGPITGAAVDGLVFNCSPLHFALPGASTGLHTKHVYHSTFTRLMMRCFSGPAIFATAYSAPTGVINGANENSWSDISTLVGIGASAKGLLIGEADFGSAPHLDVAQNTFTNCLFYPGTAAGMVGVHIRFADNLTFIHCQTIAAVGVKYTPVVGNTAFPGSITWINSSIQGGPVVETGYTGTNLALYWPYPTGDGEPLPADTQQDLVGVTTDRRFFGQWQNLPAITSNPVYGRAQITPWISGGPDEAGFRFQTTYVSFGEKMTLSGRGYLGLGVTPAAPLHVRPPDAYYDAGAPLSIFDHRPLATGDLAQWHVDGAQKASISATGRGTFADLTAGSLTGVSVAPLNINAGAAQPVNITSATGQAVNVTATGGGASVNFLKTSGPVGSGQHSLYLLDQVGAIDAYSGYWNGLHFGGLYIAESGVPKFPRLAQYSRAATATDPTDYEWRIEAGNSTAVNQSLTLQSFIGAQAGQAQGAINLNVGPVTALQLTGKRNVVVGEQAALAVNAVDGHLHIPAMPGAPTGAPTTFTGKMTLVGNAATGLLHTYSGGQWRAIGGGHEVAYDGAALTYRPKFELIGEYGLQARDTGVDTQLRTRGVQTGLRNLVTDGGARGFVGTLATTGTIGAGSLATVTVTGSFAGDFNVDNGIWIANAAGGGNPHFAKVTAANATGTILTIDPPAAVAVSGAEVRHDDSASLQALIDQRGHIAIPPKFYTLQRPLVLRVSSEAYSYTIKGGGAHCTHLLVQHGGSCFVAEEGVTLEAFEIHDLSMATSLASSPYTTQPLTNRGHAIDLTGANVVNYARITNCRIIGFGRWGIIADNLQGGSIRHNIIRACASGSVALLGDQTVWISGKEPNANLIEGNQFDQSPYVDTSDTNYVGVAAMPANSDLINISSGTFTADMLGRLVRVYNAGVTGGDLVGVIKAVNSSTQLRVSCRNLQASALTGLNLLVEKVNIADIALLQSHHNRLVANICQGNRSGSPQVVHGLRAEGCAGLEIVGQWFENSGGAGGFDFYFKDCENIDITGYFSNVQPLTVDNANPAGNFKLVNTFGLNIKAATIPNPGLLLDMDASSRRVRFVNCQLPAPEFLFSSFVTNPAEVEIDESCVFYSDRISGPSSMHQGTKLLYDALYGENWAVNGSFADGKMGWTDTLTTDWSIVSGTGRYGTYARINTQSLSDSGVNQIAVQTIPIPDSEPSGPFVLAYDQLIEHFGAAPQLGREVSINVVGAGGASSYGALKVTSLNYSSLALNRWQRAQIGLWLGTGTNRSFSIQFLASRGPNTPRVRVANFRLMRGRHAAGSHDQPITEFAGGTLRQPLRLVGLSSAPTAPPAGSLNLYPKVVSGAVKLFTQDAAGAETEVGAGGGGGGVAGSGTANAIARWTGASALGNSIITEATGQISVAGDLLVNSANGRIWGVNGLASGHTVHFQFGGDSENEIETAYGSGPIIKAYHGLTVQNATAFVAGPALTAKSRQADKEGLRVDTPALGTADVVQFRPAGAFKSGISAAGRLKYDSSLTATAATAGSNGAVPSQVAGYLQIDIGGTIFKVPYFNN